MAGAGVIQFIWTEMAIRSFGVLYLLSGYALVRDQVLFYIVCSRVCLILHTCSTFRCRHKRAFICGFIILLAKDLDYIADIVIIPLSAKVPLLRHTCELPPEITYAEVPLLDTLRTML